MFIVIHSIFLLISCHSGTSKDPGTVFRYNSPTGISSLDPAFARTQENIRAVNQLFNGLVSLDSSLNVQSCIARNWEISEDGKLYRFHLRTDVFFHKHPLFHDQADRRVKASDFVYSFLRIQDPKTASDGAWIFNGTVAEQAPFQAVNDSTLEIRLRRPFAPFLSMLSMAYCFVVPQKIVEQTSVSFGTAPVGTGPFVFAHWLDGIRLNLLRNPEYFEATASNPIPYVDAVSISFVQSKQTSLLRYLQGELDVFTGLESSFKDRILEGDGTLKEELHPEHRLLKVPFLNTEYLAFNLEDTHSIVQDLRVRRAIHLAVDRTAMITYLRNNVGHPSGLGFIPAGLPSHVDMGHVIPQRDSAQQLIQHLPEDRRRLKLTTTKEYMDLCVLVQNDLRKIGLQLDIDVIPSGLLKQQKSSGDLEFFRSSWIADYPDGENYMACFYSPNKAPNGPNYTRFHNTAFDRGYERLIQEIDPLERLACIRDMEEILARELPYILLFYDESIWLQRKKVQGLRVNALNHLDLRYVRIPEA